MEHDVEAIRVMQRYIAELEASRIDERTRTSDLRLLILLFGLVALFGIAVFAMGDLLHISEAALAVVERATWLLFAVAGAGILYVALLQMRQNGRVRRDGVRLVEMQNRAFDRQDVPGVQ